MFTALLCDGTMGAVARRGGRASGGGATTGSTTQQAAPKQTSQKTMGARAATNSRTAPRATGGAKNNAGAKTGAVGARAAKPTTSGTTSAPKTVAARAGVKQNIINSGTNVSGAAKNVLVDHTCQEKYNGCMDSFCMLNNANGGRCVCSDRNAELNTALAEIEKTDELSYQMATMGLEQLEMGLDADAAISMSKGVVDSLKDGKKNLVQKKSDKDGKSRGINFDAWEGNVDTGQDIFAASSAAAGSDDITNKQGDELYKSAMKICAEQIPECKASMESVQLLYAQQIKSDCLAFENTLKKRRSESKEKLQTAERALRDAALEQHQTQNKYDLGQCTAAFSECMQTTGGCGQDFSDCVVVAVDNNSGRRKSNSGATKKYKIEGEVYDIEIFAATYEKLLGKKPVCEHVTKQCVNVANKVWDTFVRDVAPQIKAAETASEDNIRQDCVANVSSCFQTACKDTMDPNDPDGSYDMCLSRPETMLNVCKMPLNNCGIDTSKKGAAEKSEIWQFVLARLASMRVNECSKQIKKCFAEEDRCGADYSKCIGLDMNTIVNMCPLDKLTACDSSEYGTSETEKEAYVYDVAQGVLLDVDNNLLHACQNIVKQKMVEICGDVNSCYLSDVSTELGRGSLQTVQEKSGNYIVSGIIDFNNINFVHPTDPANADYSAKDPGKYSYKLNYVPGCAGNDVDQKARKRIEGVITALEAEVNRKVSLLAMDPKVNMCVTGRNISQIVKGGKHTVARFPNLLSSYVNTIYGSLMAIARSNYNRDYAQEISTANGLSREYKNIIMCNSMAELTEGFTPDLKDRYGIIDSTGCSVTLAGTSSEDQMKAMTESSSRTTPICSGARSPDGKSCAGNGSFMIATEERSAFYESGPQVCRITTRLYACKGYEAIYEGESKSWNAGVNAGVNAGIKGTPLGVGGSVGASVGGGTSRQTHKGQFCNAFAEPTVSEQIISFNTGEAVFGEVNRGNAGDTYYNSSVTESNINNSWSVGVELGIPLGKGNVTNVEAGDNATVNVVDDSSVVEKNKTKTRKR